MSSKQNPALPPEPLALLCPHPVLPPGTAAAVAAGQEARGGAQQGRSLALRHTETEAGLVCQKPRHVCEDLFTYLQ